MSITWWSAGTHQPSAMAQRFPTGLGSPSTPSLGKGHGNRDNSPSRMTVMGLGRNPSPPGHKVLYSAVEKGSQGG